MSDAAVEPLAFGPPRSGTSFLGSSLQSAIAKPDTLTCQPACRKVRGIRFGDDSLGALCFPRLSARPAWRRGGSMQQVEDETDR